jgi:hypothetical protein
MVSLTISENLQFSIQKKYQNVFMILILCIIYLIFQIWKDEPALVYQIESNNSSYQIHFGRKILNDSNDQKMQNPQEAYMMSDMEDYFEFAIKVLYRDFNHHYFWFLLITLRSEKKTLSLHQFDSRIKYIQ